MTWPRASSDWLIVLASRLRALPLSFVRPALSDPAKSASRNRPRRVAASPRLLVSTRTSKTACDRDERSFIAVAAAARLSPPSFRTLFASRALRGFRSLRPTTVTPPWSLFCRFKALG